jgi:hypothetical protein
LTFNLLLIILGLQLKFGLYRISVYSEFGLRQISLYIQYENIWILLWNLSNSKIICRNHSCRHPNIVPIVSGGNIWLLICCWSSLGGPPISWGHLLFRKFTHVWMNGSCKLFLNLTSFITIFKYSHIVYTVKSGCSVYTD